LHQARRASIGFSRTITVTKSGLTAAHLSLYKFIADPSRKPPADARIIALSSKPEENPDEPRQPSL
jgi:hypothetical protein